MQAVAMSALCLRCVQAAVAFAGAAAVLIIPLLSFCAASPPLSPPVQRYTLPSGLRVIVAEQAGTTLAALDLRVRVGSGAETPATNGTAHFIEHLLFKGTGMRKLGDIDQAVEELGGELTAQTTRDATRFTTTLPAPKWRDALAVIADMTRHPAFRSDDVAAEKPVILSEMAIARTEPTRAGFNRLAGLAFGSEDPYRLPLMGSEANVRAMTSEALKTFWEQWYRPENMTLVVTGNITAAEVKEEAERLFPGTSFPRPDAPKSPGREAKPIPAPTGARSVISDAGVGDLATIFVGFRSPSASDADASAPVEAVVSLLAERSDMGSGQGKLNEALVTRQGLALSVTANYVSQRGESLVVIAATGRRANAEKLEQALLAELKKLPTSDFNAADALQARQNLRAAQSSDGSVQGNASRLALADVLGLSPDETDDSAQYSARLVRLVTPESLNAAARQYLSPDQGAIVVIQPSALP